MRGGSLPNMGANRPSVLVLEGRCRICHDFIGQRAAGDQQKKVNLMPFEYACFLSYRHLEQSQLAEQFIDELSSALQGELGAWVEERLFIDSERIRAGAFFNPALADALCRSVCMLVVYTPNYFSKSYILRARISSYGKARGGAAY